MGHICINSGASPSTIRAPKTKNSKNQAIAINHYALAPPNSDMPFWRIYHPEGTFATEDHKRGLSQDITSIYSSRGLPAFYVVIVFIPIHAGNFWVGGQLRDTPPKSDSSSIADGSPTSSNKPFIRIFASNIARRLPNPVYRDRFLKAVDEKLKPHIADWGYDWEYHLDETERELWKINGMVPPPTGSEDEKRWFSENKPLELESAFNDEPAHLGKL
ncbi:hypothetical protein P152DRAFT_456920 [Eremomyces bilateralis CBS 781.70]|uniref:Tautomerase cis-CaaD-like domain-containing protein n=1 Tax=Eremomyces bilateralis CBS 781.70 TaxID=1392243 RepID=A0A6G1G984_9PEZI|nr:uncharacterized protein P152DRAFT_456920 [Eremomyces bilateralis CBS 781.70]KAF1814655.1 hypothetical protein P152DRAFT_456920 [Eremomyces bilateralis CBS 781.70]